ncbi:hypothetical protein ACOME3_004249 [Neoechinorhynchus agilis]
MERPVIHYYNTLITTNFGFCSPNASNPLMHYNFNGNTVQTPLLCLPQNVSSSVAAYSNIYLPHSLLSSEQIKHVISDSCKFNSSQDEKDFGFIVCSYLY